MKKVCFGISGIVVLILMHVTEVWAGDISLYEVGSPDLSTAFAGTAAFARDASTSFSNPAGMTRLDRSQYLIGIQPFYITTKFRKDDETTVSGGNGGNIGKLWPGGGFFYVHALKPDIRLGFSLTNHFGLGLNYGDGWVGRYHIQNAALITFDVNPSVAYRINDWLSVGAGASIMPGLLRAKMAINNPNPSYGDGMLRTSDNTVGFGGNSGVLLEPRKGTRFGIAYRSPVKFKFKDIIDDIDHISPLLKRIFLGFLTHASISPGDQVDIDIMMPQQLMVSAYQDITDKLAVVSNFGWQDYSQFGKVHVTIDGKGRSSFTENLHYRDVWHWAAGLQYRIAEKWLISSGFAHDSSMVREKYRSPSTPVDRQLRYGAGVQYDMNECFTFGLAYEYVDGGNGAIDKNRDPLSGRVKGDYGPNNIQFVNFTITKRF